MKTALKLAAVTLVVAGICHPTTGSAQGGLTPPGAPSPVMKTLDQIKAGTPINSAPYYIINPGCYFLTTNLTVSSGNAITIDANGVTLDLNGFTISSSASPASGSAIEVNPNRTETTIINGNIRGNVTQSGGVFSGTGFLNGIYCSSFGVRARVQAVLIAGIMQNGISLGGTGNYSIIRDCSAFTVGGNGIVATTVSDSTVEYAGMTGINAITVNNCMSFVTGPGTGIYTYNAVNSYGGSSSGPGIEALSGAINCYGTSSSGYGLRARRAAQNCNGVSTSSEGIHGDGVLQNCYGESSTGYGLYCLAAATGCYGVSSSGTYGLYAVQAFNSQGIISSGSGTALFANDAQNCQGDTSGSGIGVVAACASNCRGNAVSGTGILVTLAQNCYGYSTGAGGTGLHANIAIGCFGQSITNGTGINTYIANSSQPVSSSGTPLVFSYKYNMP